MKQILCACSENRVRPELSIPAAGQNDRGLRGREWARTSLKNPILEYWKSETGVLVFVVEFEFWNLFWKEINLVNLKSLINFL